MIILQHITEKELLKINLLRVSGVFLNKRMGVMEDKVLTIMILRYTFFKKTFVGSFFCYDNFGSWRTDSEGFLINNICAVALRKS